MAEQQFPTDEQRIQALKDAEKRGAGRPKRFSKSGADFTAKSLSREEVAAMMPFYKELGIKPLITQPIKRFMWYHRLFSERRKLRKDIRKNYGMKLKPREFEQLAREVGLGLDRTYLFWPWLIFSWLFGAGGIITLFGATAVGIAVFYGWSAINEVSGSFTIQLNPDLLSSNFVLSETEDFAVKTARLMSTPLEKVNAMTVADLPQDLDDKKYEGSHIGEGYVAYSFYIMNDGTEPDDYEYVLHMQDSLCGVDKAVWIMLYEDGHQVMYAAASSDGDPERLFGYIKDPPFYDTAYDAESQYYQKDNGKWGIVTTAYESDEIVCRGIVENVQPGEKHRYTVVLWVEGYDPECTDELFDGYAKYYMEFNSVTDEKRTLFSSLWRTEYEEPLKEIETEAVNESEEKTESE